MTRDGCPYPGVRPLLLAALSVAFGAHLAYGARADYVGAQACKTCHEDAFAVWQASAHARADMSLGPSPKARCLGCHATGEAPAGRAAFPGVTCEACHGPGKGYAADDIMRDPTLSRALGLRDLEDRAARAALCAECHGAATRLEPFDVDAAWRAIEHGRKPTTRQQEK